MKAHEDIIRRVPFLADLADRELSGLLASSRTVSYRKGSTIFDEDDVGDALFVLLTGGVKVVLQGERGQEITLNELVDRIAA